MIETKVRARPEPGRNPAAPEGAGPRPRSDGSNGALATATGDRVDVVVVGGGNAALCAAITAREAGASVLLLERSAEWDRGGNSKHTRNIRCARDGASAAQTYGADEFLSDLRSVTGDGLDTDLARYLIAESRDVGDWMEAQGIRWQPALRGTLQLDRTNRFFLGGGKALVNTYYARAISLGVSVQYGQRVDRFVFDGDRVTSVVASSAGEACREIPCRAVVVASGGFEANLEWLRRYWGDAVDNYRIRGTPHNDGHVLQTLLEAGAETRGTERGFHAIAVDARTPRFDGGIVTRVDSIPFGIVVNSSGERFYDEGEEIWPKRYATWGGLIARQPDQAAYSIFDSKAWGSFIPCMFAPHRADTIADLAEMLGAPSASVVATVDSFNRAAHDHGEYDMSQRDGRGTTGLAVAKSNWALTIDTPPFYAYPLRPGITFTYLGVGIDAYGRVRRGKGSVFSNLFAAGEVMSGNILLKGYVAGIGMTIGTVFGRLAGREAARAART